MARARRNKVAKVRVKRKAVIPPSQKPHWKTAGLSLALDARDWALAAVDGVEGGPDAIIEQHARAWETGTHPGSGQLQPPLVEGGKAGRDAAAGLRPNLRGVTHAPRGLAKSGPSIVNFYPRVATGSPKRARVVISVPRGRAELLRFLAEEAEEHNVEYLSVEGQIDHSVRANLSKFVSSILEG